MAAAHVLQKIERHAEALGIKGAKVRQHVVRGPWFLEGEARIDLLSSVLTSLSIRGVSCGSLGAGHSYYEISNPEDAVFRAQKYSLQDAKRNVKALSSLVKTLNGFDAKKVVRFGARIHLLATLVSCINKEITADMGVQKKQRNRA